MERTFQRILIVRDDRIGDVILTLPMAQVLRKHFPSVQIAMLIQRYTAEIVEDHHCIDDLLFYDDNDRPVSFVRLVGLLSRRQFDVVFHTHPSFRLALMTWLAGIDVRVGTGYRWYSFLFNRKVWEHRKDARFHELEYNLHLLRAIGCTVDDEKIVPSLSVDPEVTEKAKNLLHASGIGGNDALVILHPGSGRSARDWSATNFGMLGRRLSGLPHVKVVVVGGEKEQKVVSEVQSIMGTSAVVWVNQLTLREYAALTQQATLFIANSTGPIHIAAAVGTSVIGLYPQVTALSAKRWGPYTEKKTIFSPVNKPVNCNKCLFEQGGHCACMETISVDEVYEAAERYVMEHSSLKV